jgi:hypothetical protein
MRVERIRVIGNEVVVLQENWAIVKTSVVVEARVYVRDCRGN